MRCLGTMLRCRERGDGLHFICLTDGSSGVLRDPYPSRKVAAGIRRGEMTRLAKAVKATYQCLGERDAFLQDTPAVRMKLVEAIRKTRADVIFTHFAEDYNEDHITTHRLVRHCCSTLRPTLLPFKALYNYDAIATFIAEYLSLNFLDVATELVRSDVWCRAIQYH